MRSCSSESHRPTTWSRPAAKANPRRACTSSYTLQPRAFVTSPRVSNCAGVGVGVVTCCSLPLAWL